MKHLLGKWYIVNSVGGEFWRNRKRVWLSSLIENSLLETKLSISFSDLKICGKIEKANRIPRRETFLLTYMSNKEGKKFWISCQNQIDSKMTIKCEECNLYRALECTFFHHSFVKQKLLTNFAKSIILNFCQTAW